MDETSDDLVLHLEHFALVGVELVGPQMRAAVGVNQLGVDPDTCAAPLSASFEDVTNAKLLAGRFHVFGLAAIGEGRGSRYDEAVRKTRQAGGQLLGQHIAKIVLAGVAGKIGERQHYDGKMRFRGDRVLWRRDRGKNSPPQAHGDDGDHRQGDRQSRASRPVWRDTGRQRDRGRLLRKIADVERVDPDWFGDVLELDWSEITNGDVEPALRLSIRVLREGDSARLRNALQSSGNVDAIPMRSPSDSSTTSPT
jgi:hypothetical protein